MLETDMSIAVRSIMIVVVTSMLAGCEFAPHPLTMSRESVTIQYDPVLYSEADAWPEARTACARYNRVPVLALARGIGTRYVTFDCVDQKVD